MTAKRRATVRAENSLQARASPEEADIFHSSQLIWTKKAERRAVIQREQTHKHKRLKHLRDIF